MDRGTQLRYGSVVQIIEINDDKETEIHENYFFISKVDKNEITLKSNEEEPDRILKLDDQGKITNENINGIILLYEPKDNQGYAYFHGYEQNVVINVVFIGGDTLKGRITSVKEDMITVVSDDESDSLLYFIDFEYRGLHSNLGIQEITTDGNVVVQEDPVEEDEPDEGEVFIYDIQQQIGDYIEKNDAILRKRTLKREVDNYIELTDQYCDLEHQINIKLLPTNQFLKSILTLNPNFMMPVSSYVDKYFYHAEEDSMEEEMDNVVLQNDDDLIEEMKRNIKTPFENVKLQKQKKRDTPFHKEVMLRKDIPIALIDHNGEYPLFTKHSYIGLKDQKIYKLLRSDPQIKLRKNNFSEHFLETGTRVIIDGVKVHPLPQLLAKHYMQRSSSLLTKTLTHENPHYNHAQKERVYKVYKEEPNTLHNPKHFFNKIGHVYYPITKHEVKMKDFFTKMNISVKNIIDELGIQGQTNIYELVRELSNMNVTKLDEHDIKWIRNKIKIQIQAYKSKARDKTIDLPDYEFLSDERLFIAICELYKSYQYQSSYPSEIMHQTFIDQSQFIVETLKYKNKGLYNSFDDESIQALLLSINETLQSDDYQKMKSSLKPVKTYYSLKELQEDKGKMVLRDSDDPNKTNKANIFEDLSTFQKFGYTENASAFEKKIDYFLTHYNFDLNIDDEEHDELKETLFGDYEYKDDLFQNLVTFVLEKIVREGEVAVVLDVNEPESKGKKFIYMNQDWIPHEEYQENISKKKLLRRTSNAMKEFDEIRASTVNEYIVKMTNDYQNEQRIRTEKEMILESDFLKKTLTLKHNQFMRHLFQYNQIKKELHFEYQKLTDDDEYEIKTSKYLPLFHHILDMDNLHKKYSCIQTFVKMFTVVMNDPDWLYCVETKTKLVPIFIYELSEVFLKSNKENYNRLLHYYCRKEGGISDHGDDIIHKKTGYVLQKREFNTKEEEFSRNAKLIVDIEDLKNERPDDEIMLTQEESFFGNDALRLLRNVSIDFSNADSKRCFREMFTIFQQYKTVTMRQRQSEDKKPLDAQEKIIHKIYTIWCFALVYIQCHDLKITKKVPMCNASFSGYPLYDIEDKKGIEYIACMFKAKSKSTKANIYEAFRKNRTKEYIVDELVKFMNAFVLQNQYVNTMLRTKRDNNAKQNAISASELEVLQLPKRFAPCLESIKLKDFDYANKTPVTFLNKIQHQSYVNQSINMNIQLLIRTTIENEKHLVNHYEEQEPLFVNYCCNKRFIMDYFLANKELTSLLDKSKQSEDILLQSKQILCNSLVNFTKKNTKMRVEDAAMQYDLKTVYLFIITHGNFDNPLPIEPFLSSIVPSKPGDDYDRTDSIDTKIKKLKQEGFEFTSETLSNLLLLKSRTSGTTSQTDLTTNHVSIEEELEHKHIFPFKLNKRSVPYLQACKSLEYQKYENIQIRSNHKRRIENKLKGFYYAPIDVRKKMIQYLSNVNYLMLCVIPQIILGKHVPELTADVVDLYYPAFAQSHGRKLRTTYGNLYACFEGIPFEDISVKGAVNMKKQLLMERNEYRLLLGAVSSSENRSAAMIERESAKLKQAKDYNGSPSVSVSRIRKNIEKIASYKILLDLTLYQSNLVDQYAYMEFIFYKVLNLYDMGNIRQSMSDLELQVANKINEALYTFLDKINSTMYIHYEEVRTRTTQIKQSEKKVMTERFRMAENQQQRQLDKVMLDAKLGDRSIALSKGLFVYDKTMFDEDDARAREIQEMRDQTYLQEQDDGTVQENIGEDHYANDDDLDDDEDEYMNTVDGDLDLDYDEDVEDTY